MSTERRLPPGGTTDAKRALVVVRDSAKLADAYAYWNARLKAYGEDVLETGKGGSDGWKAMAATPDKTLDELLPETRRLLEGLPTTFAMTGGGSQRTLQFRVSSSGCLFSSAEIAAFVNARDLTGGPGSVGMISDILTTVLQPADLEKLLGSLRSAAASPPAADSEEAWAAARGLIAARETYDGLRRFKICADHASLWGAKTSALLAIYRQEGAFVISPPASSYEHGPLILTGGGCRPETIDLGSEPPRRPGFNLVHVAAATAE